LKLSTLKNPSEFQRISKTGRKFHGAAFVMLAVKTSPEQPFRLGLTASRKVGGAVVRNRARRRLREMVRLCGTEKLAGREIVLIARAAAADCDFALMRADFEKGLAATL
jgi:ribonuclease P protein component